MTREELVGIFKCNMKFKKISIFEHGNINKHALIIIHNSAVSLILCITCIYKIIRLDSPFIIGTKES